MAHWFHRNPLKATAVLNFDVGKQAKTTLARKICGEIRLARSHLIDLLPNPNQNVAAVKAATDKYLGLLQGFIVAATTSPEDANTGLSPQGTGEGIEDDQNTIQDSSESAGVMGGDSVLRNAIKSTWTNSLGGKNIVQRDAIFEEINMLINVALWYTKHAAKLAASQKVSEDDTKEVHRSLREAAGMFKYVQSNLLSSLFETPGDGSDLDQRVLSAYELLCTAEAQEVTIARAIELKHSNSLIAALAIETSKLFTKADEVLKSLDEKQAVKWKKYIKFKSVFYLSYAHCYNGNALLAKDKGGDAVRALKESLSLFQKAQQLSREYSKTKGPGTVAKPEQHPFFLRLQPIVERILEKTERENRMIYHDKVPDELPEIDSKSMYGLASPVEYELPGKSSEWTPAVDKGFVAPPAAPPAEEKKEEKKEEKEASVKAVKEEPIDSENHPSNTTGCIIS